MDHDSGDLLPFRQAAPSKYWTSKNARKTETFGYKYQEAQGQPSEIQMNFRANYSWAVRNNNNVYGKPPANMLPQKDRVDAAQVFKSQPSSISKTVASVPSTLSASTGPNVSANGNGQINKAAPSGRQVSSEQKQIALQRTLRNMGNESSTGKSSIKDESKVERQWYVDSVVER